MDFSIKLFCLITVFTIFIIFFTGLLVATNPYLAVKSYPDNYNCEKITTQIRLIPKLLLSIVKQS